MYRYLVFLMATVLIGCGYDPSCLTGCKKTREVEPESAAQPGCTASRVTGGVLVSCPDGEALIRDGIDGQDGAPGEAGKDGAAGTDGKDAVLPDSAIVGFVDPCGEEQLDEILFVAADGTLFGHYSDGVRQHLARLVPGRYATTDGFSCTFDVTEDNQVIPVAGGAS